MMFGHKSWSQVCLGRTFQRFVVVDGLWSSRMVRQRHVQTEGIDNDECAIAGPG